MLNKCFYCIFYHFSSSNTSFERFGPQLSTKTIQSFYSFKNSPLFVYNSVNESITLENDDSEELKTILTHFTLTDNECTCKNCGIK